MKCRVEKSELSGKIACPPSKSYTHRAIFLASLAGDKSVVRNPLLSEDTQATISACKKFGAVIDIKNGDITVEKRIIPDSSELEIDAGNSGTTIRIAAGIASLFKSKIMLTGDSSLQKRPMQPLLDALEQMGAECSSNKGCPPINIKGPISSREITVPGNVSSQFISSLMICTPLTSNGINMEVEGNIVSRPYIKATMAAMKEFGSDVVAINEYKNYTVYPDGYTRAEFDVPSDASSLAMLLSAAVLVGDMEISANLGDLPQGDKAFVNMLEKMGVTVEIKDVIRVSFPEKLSGGVFDLRDTPDLLPPLAILALKSSEPIIIKNVGHARIKETDRIAIISSELAKLGVDIKEEKEGLELRSADRFVGAELDSHNDHRLFMAFCIAGMYVGDCTVSDPDSASVSYPDFVKEMTRLGGKISLAE